jgi:hypothetical protein
MVGGEGKVFVGGFVEMLRRRQRLPILVGAKAYANLLFLAEHHNPTNEWMLPSSGFVQA